MIYYASDGDMVDDKFGVDTDAFNDADTESTSGLQSETPLHCKFFLWLQIPSASYMIPVCIFHT